MKRKVPQHREASKQLDVISRYDISISMTRILVDLADEDIKWLDACATERGKSLSEVLLDAIRWDLQKIGAMK